MIDWLIKILIYCLTLPHWLVPSPSLFQSLLTLNLSFSDLTCLTFPAATPEEIIPIVNTPHLSSTPSHNYTTISSLSTITMLETWFKIFTTFLLRIFLTLFLVTPSLCSGLFWPNFGRQLKILKTKLIHTIQLMILVDSIRGNQCDARPRRRDGEEWLRLKYYCFIVCS